MNRRATIKSQQTFVEEFGQKTKDKTNEQLAEMFEVSAQTISNWRNGHTYPNRQYASLFEVLGIKIKPRSRNNRFWRSTTSVERK